MISIQNIKRSCFVVLMALLTISCHSDDTQTGVNNIPLVKNIMTLGGSKNESAQSVISTSDHGYAVFGYTQSNDGDILNKTNESFDYYLLKFNDSDDLEWQKSYGGTQDDKGHSIVATNDGGYAILGSSNSNDGDVSINAGYDDFWILKLNNTGDIQWEKSFGFAGIDRAFSLIQTLDGGYFMVGVLDVSASNGEGNNRLAIQSHAGGDYWAIKLDALGNFQWSRYFGGTYTDTAYDTIETTDGDFLVVGSSDSADVDINNNKGAYDFWVIKISNSGTLIWEKSFGGEEIDEAKAIAMTNDGHYIIVGDTRSQDQDITQNNGASDIWTIKITSDGELVWDKSYGGTGFEGVQGIHKTQNNNFIIAGNSRSSDGDLNNNYGQNDTWLFEIDPQGALLWQKTIGGSGVDLLMDASQLNDGSIIGVGNSNSSTIETQTTKGFNDILILHIQP